MTAPPLLILGPTASGKSAVAMALAERMRDRGGAVIINGDSQQVYRELRVLTARPTAEDERRVPHRLFGFRPAAEPCSAAAWAKLADEEIAAARAAGLLPIVVGGTGLYFRTLLSGLSPIPDVPDAIRVAARQRMDSEGPHALHAALAMRDPEMAARLQPSDRQRVLRAWEVLVASGRSLADWQRQPPPRPGLSDAVRVALMPPRAEIVRRIDTRLQEMVEAGAVGEVQALLALGLARDLPAMKAVGVDPFRRHLEGELELDQAIALSQIATRQYAKRQATWIRHQAADWTPVVEQQMERIVERIFSFIC